MKQILGLCPDFVQIQTWNDAGESHYIGNVWPNSIHGSPCHAYIDDFDHKGWQNLYRPFIRAYKAGVTDVANVQSTRGPIEGAFWYHPHLSHASCHGDELGRPKGAEHAQDVLNVAIFVSPSSERYMINVYSGGYHLSRRYAYVGLNAYQVEGLQPGTQSVTVTNESGMIVAEATGIIKVVRDSKVWNLNYAVVGLTSRCSNPQVFDEEDEAYVRGLNR
jgi:glucan endo-1,3-alpha-glucosidase